MVSDLLLGDDTRMDSAFPAVDRRFAEAGLRLVRQEVAAWQDMTSCLAPEQWSAPTYFPGWTVRDAAGTWRVSRKPSWMRLTAACEAT
jgi:hypothetical protein